MPLVIDLDGTLTPSDSLGLMLTRVLTRRPWLLVPLYRQARRGKAALKIFLWERVGLDTGSLSWSSDLLTWLRAEVAAGRPAYIATGSPEPFAIAVAAHLDLFSGVFGTTHDCNLTGPRKAARLVERFGDQGFDYAGNAMADVAVWKHSRRAIVCNAPDRVAKAAAVVAVVDRSFGTDLSQQLHHRVGRAGWQVLSRLSDRAH